MSNSSTSGTKAMTDIGNGQRFAERNAKFVRFVPEWNKWVIWNNNAVWSANADTYVQRLAKLTIQGIVDEAPRSPDPTAMLKWARASASVQRTEAMLKMAKSEEVVSATEAQFDADPMLFNVENGTIDLRTGKLRKHRRKDFITKLAPVEYDSDATFAMWDDFLERMIPDRHLREYVQKAAGYTLTGRTDEQVFFFPFGRGASGKGTFLDAVNAVMGDYASSTRFDTFLDQGKKDYDMWRHVRSRMVSAQEVREGERFDEAMVKTITGGDLVTAERKYCDPFQFRPQWKLWLAANSRPHIDAGDSGMWRRVRVIPFTVSLEKAERDPLVRTTLSTHPSARKAILAWMVRGCLMWQKEGLGEPPAVVAAGETYRDSTDNFGRFFAAHYVLDAKGTVPTAAILCAYESYCAENGDKRLAERDIFKRLRARGCESRRVGKRKRRSWAGLSALADGETDTAAKGAGTALTEEQPGYDADAEAEAFLERLRAEEEAEEEAWIESALSAAEAAREEAVAEAEAAIAAVLASLEE